MMGSRIDSNNISQIRNLRSRLAKMKDHPRTMEVGGRGVFSLNISDMVGPAITTVVVGTYDVNRTRGTAQTNIVTGGTVNYAYVEADGLIALDYTLPSDFAEGDLYNIIFKDIVVTIAGNTYALPYVYYNGRVSREEVIETKVDTLQATATSILADVQDDMIRTQDTISASATGTIYTVYERSSSNPLGVYQATLNLSNMVLGDTTIVRPYRKINSAGVYEQVGTDAENTYTDVQATGTVLIDFDKVLTQEGFKIELEMTTTGAVLPRTYDLEVFEI